MPIPISWGRTNFFWGENIPAITFRKLIGRQGKHGRVESICQKEVIIDNDMTLLIKVNGVYLNYKNFGIESSVTSYQLSSIENVKAVITIVDEREVCQGCPEIKLSSYNSQLLNSFSYVDKSDTVRHNNCLLLLPTENDKQFSNCKFCRSAKSILDKKNNSKTANQELS